MYDYKGNQFWLEIDKGWGSRPSTYRIVNLMAYQEDLWLPESYMGLDVTVWDMEKRSDTFQKVRVLHIPAKLEQISIRNDMFPNLERVEVAPTNAVISTDGRLIIADEPDYHWGPKRKRLKYCPVLQGDSISIPDDVKEIKDKAFAGTQYREIRFPDTNMEISRYAFDGSAWLREQSCPIVIGNMLYKIDDREECLEVPPGVKKIHDGLFTYESRTRKIIIPFVPSPAVISELNRVSCFRTIVLSSAQANINIRMLRRLESLETIIIAEGHRRYKTEDGVVFSADGRRLVYYPKGKRDTVYNIPEGVRKIEESAFAGQRHLQKVVMPDSVNLIGTRAFFECEMLSDVRMSPNIREIPDSNAWQMGGVFEGCESLGQIALPDELNYLGSYAFARSGLKSIELNPRLQQMGDYALMAKGLMDVRLPESVKRVGKGSLLCAERVEVYEGTARGLFSALNAVSPEMKNKSANVEWHRCDVTVLHKKSGRREEFMIPGSLKRSAAWHLDAAWNGEKIDYEEYDEILSEIGNTEEKLEFARCGVLRHKDGEENEYTEYIRRMSCKIGTGLLEDGKEKEFLSFLKMGYLSAESIAKLIRVSNKNGMTVCTAYLMEAQSKLEKKKKVGFRL